MKKVDLVKMAGGNLIRRKMRTSLTVLGIVIGTLSILLMISLGIGLKENIAKEFADMGSTKVIQVYRGSTKNRTGRFAETGGEGALKASDVEVLKGIQGVTQVIPTIYAQGRVKSGKYEGEITIVGVDPDQAEALGLAVQSGSLFTGGANEAIFGVRAIEAIRSTEGNDLYEEDIDIDFGFGESPIGDFDVNVYEDRLRLYMTGYTDDGYEQVKVFPLEGVGILKSGDYATEENMYMPIHTVRRMNADLRGIHENSALETYGMVYVQVDDLSQINAITRTIKAKGYSAFSNQEILDSINSSMQIVQVVLGILGGISLVVAAIGITNTMVMAVSERKKEIGVMKVIGATIQDIKELFLLESAMIGAIGGLLGVGISVGIATAISSPLVSKMIAAGMGGGEGASGFAFSIPLWLVGAGLVFTTMIGVISGYLPARQAMQSSALDALRNE